MSQTKTPPTISNAAGSPYALAAGISAHVAMADHAFKMGDLKSFGVALRRAVELDPKNIPALQVLTGLNLAQGSLAAVAAVSRKILAQDANNVDATLNLGITFFNLNNHELARQSFERVLKFQPDHPVALETLQSLRLANASQPKGKRGTLLIQTYPYNGCSAGVRALHYLAAMLRAADISVAVTHKCFYNPTIPIRAEPLPEDIVVYPDASRGNRLNARRICRYMMYYASAYYGGDRIAKDECTIVFHKNYLEDIQAHCDNALGEEDIVTFPILDKEWCFPEAKTIENVLYVGKGKGKALPNIDYIQIAAANASQNHSAPYSDHYAHARTLAVLRKTKNFYTMDENTLMSCEAALCGCKVFFVKGPDSFEEQTNILDVARPQIMCAANDIALARRFADRVYHFFDQRPIPSEVKASTTVSVAGKPVKEETIAAPAGPVPDVSVVLVADFDRTDATRRCMSAIRANTSGPSYELIVIDNACFDSLPDHLRSEQAAGRIRAYFNKEQVGFAQACNQGAAIARGKYVVFFKCETEPKAGWLEPLFALAEQDDSVSAVGPKSLASNGAIRSAGVALAQCADFDPLMTVNLFEREQAGLPMANERRICAAVATGCMFVRQSEFAAVGGFDEQFYNGLEDADLCLRLRARNGLAVYEPKSEVTQHELHLNRANISRFQKKWLGKVSPDVIIDEQGRTQIAPGSALRPYVATAKTKVPAAKPVVSIVIPTFNKIELTRACLAALQTHTASGTFEVIVVDNASTDGSVEFLKTEAQAGRLRAIFNQQNAGFSRGCNQGAQTAATDVLLFLNNDTQVTAGWLEPLIAAAHRPNIGAVGAKLLYANGRIQHAGIGFINGLPDHPHRHAVADAPEVNQFRELDMVTGACLMIDKKLFVQLGGFDEIYRNGVEDVDLCLRVRAAGRKVAYEPKSVVYHLEGQSEGRFNHVTENLKLFFERWGKSFNPQLEFIVPKPTKVIPAQQSLFADSGKTPKPVSVAWEGSFLDFGSLSHVNREAVGALKKGGAVAITTVGRRPASVPKELSELASALKTSAATDTQITVRHQWPPDWSRPKHGALVVIQPWEFGALPSQWVEAARGVDEFWVPSNYVRQVYIDSGVPASKLTVIPNGVDTCAYRPGVNPLPLATSKKFKFLFVGGTIARKGPDVLLKSYLEAFTAADDVCLVIKDFGANSIYKGQTFEKEVAAARQRPNAPEILYLTEELPSSDMPRLYAACNCLVHPYRGEGFGMPVLEAMACGLPVVVTQGGSTDDFVTDEAGWKIRSVRQNIGSNVGTIPLAGNGWWLEPDAAHLTEVLRHAVANPKEAATKGAHGVTVAQRLYSWDIVAAQMSARLQFISAHTIPTLPARPVIRLEKIELPAVALVGHLGTARDLLNKKNLRGAYDAVMAGLQTRPFHPEAWMLLGKIAQAAGDSTKARQFGQRAVAMAPTWKVAKDFLHAIKPSKNNISWLLVPEVAVPRLSVCLITKNEEKFLTGCLKSVRDLAHQIVVVDTGSRDKTVEIARQFGAEVHTFLWSDDFSAARNEALKHATGDWVLSLDADEELSSAYLQTLVQEMQDAKVMGYRLPIIDDGLEAEGRSFVPRLFRNAPGLFFVGRVHEQIFSSLEVRANEWGLKNQLGKSELRHHGYVKEVVVSRDKVARNLRLLKLAIEEMPGEPNLVMNLGLETIRSGEMEQGLQHYHEAWRLMCELPEKQVTPELKESLLTQLTTHLLGAKRFAEIIEFWRQPALASYDMTASLHFMLGLALLETKQFALAAAQMRTCLEKRQRPALSPINKEILTAAPCHCLALALVGANDMAEAEKAFNAALTEAPTSRSIRYDFARFQFQSDRPLEALQIVNALVAENGTESPVWQLGAQIALSRPDFLQFALDWTGEAVKHLPNDAAIVAQRAEALMLSQDMEAAQSNWNNLPGTPRVVAARVLCAVVLAQDLPEVKPEVENATSAEFLKWYRQLITFNAHSALGQINGKLELLHTVLPAAAAMMSAAVRKVRETAVA